MTTRRLAAILAADVVAFSSMMERDEEGTLAKIKALQREVIESKVNTHHGRVVKTTGDGFLIEFASPVEAVRCATAIQDALKSGALQLRIAVNLGDILIEEDGDVYGDGVNIAARLEGIADPGGIMLSGAVYDQVRKALPLAYEDLGPTSLKNIDEPVRVYAIRGALVLTPQKEDSKRLPLPDKPSIAVLPFTNMSRDPEHEFFADGITEDIITALARLKWLFVIARHSTFTYKGRAVDVRQVARDLGVRYVLEGSVRAAGQRIRITGQLIDAERGKHIWVEKYDRQLDDIFAVQDEITQNVVATIEPQLYAEEGFRANSKPPDALDSWGLVIRALMLINKVGRRENEEARTLLQQAIQNEPHYARAHAVLGWAHFWATFSYWEPNRQEGFRRALDCAEQALRLAPDEPWARMVCGLVLSSSGHHTRGIEELETALRLNPSFALAYTWYGMALLRAGRFEAAIEATEKARRMSPIDSFAGIYSSSHGLALLAARRFAEALPHLRAAIAAFPEFPSHYNALISCCGHLGLISDAQAFSAHRNKIGPTLTLSFMRRNIGAFAHCEVFLEGLAKAGVPES